MPSNYTPDTSTLPDGAAVSTLVNGDAVERDNLVKEASPGGTKKLTLALLADWVTSLATYVIKPNAARTVAPLFVRSSDGVASAGNIVVPQNDDVGQVLDLPHGSTLTSVVFYVDPSNGTPPAGNKLRTAVYKADITTNTSTDVAAAADDPATGAGYGAAHTVTRGSLSEVIDRTKYVYTLQVVGETGSGASTVQWNGTTVTYS